MLQPSDSEEGSDDSYEEDEEYALAHSSWVHSVLGALKNRSHNKALWEGEFNYEDKGMFPREYSSQPVESVAPSSPKLSKQRSSKERSSKGTQKFSKGSSRSVGTDGAPRRRRSMSKELQKLSKEGYSLPDDEDLDADAFGAGRKMGWIGESNFRRGGLAMRDGTKVYPMLGGTVEKVNKIDLMRTQTKINATPEADLQTLIEESADIEWVGEQAVTEEALESEAERFAWLRSTKELKEKRSYDPLTLDASHRTALASWFGVAELETIYDMFDHYKQPKVKAPDNETVDVIHCHDCVCCLYWVGVLPKPSIVAFCDAQVELVRLAHGDHKFMDEKNNVFYPISGFFSWMLNYRMKHAEEWILRGGLPETVCLFVKECFSQYDPKGEGLKTRQVFEVLGLMNRAPDSVDEQKRVITYIQITDIDRSGTIDFWEFLQLLRLEMEYVAHMSRAKEMDLVKGSGLSPYEVDALHEVFTQFDTKKDLSLTLQQVKHAFESGPLKEEDRKQFGRDDMKEMNNNAFKAVEQRIVSDGLRPPGSGLSKKGCVDFGEFCYLVNELQAGHSRIDCNKAVDAIYRDRSGLKRWVEKRPPSPDELRGRWELHMLERHFQCFYREIMGKHFRGTPRQDSEVPVPLFDPSKVPSAGESAAAEVTWAQLEDDDGEP
jgi:Ca2+-binding EF-hand superfamily protein